MGRKVVKMAKSETLPEQGGLFPAPPLGSMERLHKEIGKLLGDREFASAAEANAFLREKIRAGELNHLLESSEAPGGPIEEAQDLCWQAAEAPSFAAAKRLFEQALAIDPDCTDALVFMAKGARSPEAAVEILEQAVLAAAERLGGAKFMRENKGHFWGLVETRPFMRAKAALAEGYQDADRQLDAIGEFEHLLELCPSDNLGVRYPLLGRYIRVGDLHRARQLMKQYDNEESTTFLYGRLFVEILSEEFSKAKRTLKKARAENHHVYDVLTGEREGLPEPAGMYRPGDESEAGYCLDALHEGFLCNPSLIMWMIDQRKSESKRSTTPIQ